MIEGQVANLFHVSRPAELVSERVESCQPLGLDRQLLCLLVEALLELMFLANALRERIERARKSSEFVGTGHINPCLQAALAMLSDGLDKPAKRTHDRAGHQKVHDKKYEKTRTQRPGHAVAAVRCKSVVDRCHIKIADQQSERVIPAIMARLAFGLVLNDADAAKEARPVLES